MDETLKTVLTNALEALDYYIGHVDPAVWKLNPDVLEEMEFSRTYITNMLEA